MHDAPSLARERCINKIVIDRIGRRWMGLGVCSLLYNRTLWMTTTASAQIIVATCDLVSLDADDFDPVDVDVLGLPRVTVASLIVESVNP